MASPPDRLRAHDGRARRMAKLAQFFEAQPEVLAHRVIGVVVEARVVPEAVDFGRDVALVSSEPAELGQMLVADADGAKRSGKDVAVKLRVGSRAWNRPHVDDELDLRGFDERRELLDRAGGVSDGEERVGHRGRSAPPITRVRAGMMSGLVLRGRFAAPQ